MSPVILYAAIIFNGLVQTIEYKAVSFKTEKECTTYLANNQALIGSTLKNYILKTYPNGQLILLACSDKSKLVKESDEAV